MVALLPIISGISNALRVPAIATFLATLAAEVLGFFTKFFTRRVALNLTVITVILGLALSVALAIYALAKGLSYVAPPDLVLGFSYILPDNTIPCLSVIFSARVVRWVWGWQFYVITKVSS